MLELNKIYNIDCLDGLKLLDDESIDLIITSPPYNLGGKFHTGNDYWESYNNYNDDMPEELYQEWQIKVLNECYRVLKKDGSMFYNHKPRIKNGITIHPLQFVLKSNFILKQEIVWKNRSQNFDKIRFYPMSERIYWLVKDSKTKLFNEIGYSDVWEDVKNKKRHYIHKATFPLELPENIIKCFKNSVIVLDIFMGIGTTALASINQKKKFIGFEISEEYCNIANKRIKDLEKQTDIFEFI